MTEADAIEAAEYLAEDESMSAPLRVAIQPSAESAPVARKAARVLKKLGGASAVGARRPR